MTLVLDQFGPGDEFKLSLVGRRFASWSEKRLKLRFGPAEQWQDIGYFLGDYGKGTYAVVLRGSSRVAAMPPELQKRWEKGEPIDMPPVAPDQLSAVKTLDIQRAASLLQLATGRMDKIFAALTKCDDNFVRSWGLDPAAMRTVTASPTPLSSPRT